MAIAIIISLCVPASAIDPSVVVEGMAVAPDFGSWLASGIKSGAYFLGSFLSDDICPGGAENPGFNARHDFVPQHTSVNGKTGMFYVCKNCQKSAGEVLEPAYDDYVETLPAQGYTSTGGFLWQPTWADVLGLFPGNLKAPNYLESYTFDPSGTTLSFAYRPVFSLVLFQFI